MKGATSGQEVRMSNGLGALVRRARDSLGLTQGELAERIGKGTQNTSWVSRLETGAMKELPTPEDLRALARVLPVTVAQMVGAAGYDVEPVDDPRAELHQTIDAVLAPVLDRPAVVEAIVENMRHTVSMWQDFSQQPSASPPAPDAPAGEPTEESDGASPAAPAS